ncbi:hypothetical protein [Vibrio phage VEN]|uniref:Uncharacterized protein n=1 Tax=Vibrio phage VEN TaxID=2059879 RepID=A0A2H5BN00_9CAUD|nr:hypothetical protein HOS56_gp02 [Vibrio phage VEN]AUG87702.1 hypothetical protein [Vibrio phage VEN]
MQRSTAWKASRLRRVLSSHLLNKLKESTKDSKELTKLYINI